MAFEANYAPLNTWFEVRAYPSSDGLAVYFQNINNRKAAETLLQQRDQELRIITNNVPVIVSYIDSKGRFRRVNRMYEEVFGRKCEWVTGKTLEEVAGEPHYSISRPYVEQALAGKRVTYESCIRHRDGSLRDIHVSYTPQFDSAGRPDGFIAMVEDITQRKRAEHQRSQLTAELTAERARLQAVLEQMPAGVLIANSAGTTLLANQRVQQILGHEPPETRPFRASPAAAKQAQGEQALMRAVTAGDTLRDHETEINGPTARGLCCP